MARDLTVAACRLAFLLASVGLATAPAAAGEWQISGYGGFNLSADSDVDVRYGGVARSYSTEWDGASFGAPPYWGARLTYWLDGSYNNWGLSLDYSHAKVKADLGGAIGADFSHFEFTDGLNLLTLNALYRLPMGPTFTPYGGLGIGVNVPHVETVTTSGGAFAGASNTWGYQLGGATLQAQVGLEAKLTSNIALFGEYKFDYSFVDVDLKGGGSLSTEIGTSQFLIGASYKF